MPLDSTDTLVTRALVCAISWLGFGLWIWIYEHALDARRGAAGLLLRGRAVVLGSYMLNAAVMPVALLVPGLLSPGVVVIWRNITRIHAPLALLIVAVDIIINELHNKKRR